MTRKSKQDKIPLKPEKPKGLVILGRMTFIDKILKKTESQPSVGPRKVISRQPTSSLQAIESPSIAFVEVHSQTEETEQDSHEIENCRPILFTKREVGFSYPTIYQHVFFKFGYVHTRGLILEMAPLGILLYISIFDFQRRVD